MDKEELKQIYASIHTLRMEGDGRKLVLTFNISGFQSTPSAWRVTRLRPGQVQKRWNFNPHPPRGG